jgi:ABC-type dipeptide/oligopeptide/nickel transport system permease component
MIQCLHYTRIARPVVKSVGYIAQGTPVLSDASLSDASQTNRQHERKTENKYGFSLPIYERYIIYIYYVLLSIDGHGKNEGPSRSTDKNVFEKNPNGICRQ